MKKFIFLISFLAIFSASTVQAMTVDEMQRLIAQLQQQIAQLQRQLGQIPAPPDVWCHDFRVNLRHGDTGAEVRALQTALEKQGFYKRAITGNFDEYTASAVVGFQEKYREDILVRWRLVRGTGFVGPSTRAKLNELYGCDRIRRPPDDRVCLMVLTPAINPVTGECRVFRDSCQVPAGWRKVNECPPVDPPIVIPPVPPVRPPVDPPIVIPPVPPVRPPVEQPERIRAIEDQLILISEAVSQLTQRTEQLLGR